LIEERMSHANNWKKRGRNSECKGPEVECVLICLRDSKEIGVNCNGIYKKEER
jgi:hypothetical protein